VVPSRESYADRADMEETEPASEFGTGTFTLRSRRVAPGRRLLRKADAADQFGIEGIGAQEVEDWFDLKKVQACTLFVGFPQPEESLLFVT
jgi:hypothetical protein